MIGHGEKSLSKSKSYTFFDADELENREAKFHYRLETIKNTWSILNDAITVKNHLAQESKIVEKWDNYVNCSEIPKPYAPSEIRTFFSKMRYFETENINKTINWLLPVDERSILKQDVFTFQDLTMKTLAKISCPNFGIQYEKLIDLSLEVLKRIEYYLNDESLKKKTAPKVLEDVVELKSEVHKEIREFLNRYTSRVISSEVSYMEPVDIRTSQYFYDAKNVQIHLWTINNVPIRFNEMDDSGMNVNLHMLKVQIHIPNNILEENLILRGLHLNYDNLSEHARSHRNSNTLLPIDNFKALITDLYESSLHEWEVVMRLTLTVLSDLIQKQKDYTESIKTEEKQRRESLKKVEQKNKSINIPKKLKLLEPNTFPDVWNDFLRTNQEEFDSVVNAAYHPSLLNLKPNEINLKKYSILGGIYQFDFLYKPGQYHCGNYNTTNNFQNGTIYITKNINTLEKFKNNVQNEQLQATTISKEKEERSKYFILTFELPQNMCLWGEPIPCHFEDEAIEFIIETNTIESPSSNNTIDEISTETDNADMENNNIALQDINLTKQLDIEDRHTNLNKHLDLAVDFKKYLDFELNPPISVKELFDLYNHCLPRMVSSFQFPIEEKDELNFKNSSSRISIGQLQKKTRTSEKDEMGLTYKNQFNPERVFPIFADTKPMFTDDFSLTKVTSFSEFGTKTKPKKLSSLIYILEVIKAKYMKKHELLIKDPFFSNMNKFNKKAQKEHLKMQTKSQMPIKSITLKKPQKRHSNVIDLTYKIDQEELIHQKSRPYPKKAHSVITIMDTTEIPVVENKYSRWTNEYIHRADFDRTNRRITILTDRLGTIGFACKQYLHFPFRSWSIKMKEESNDLEIIVTIVTRYIKCVIFVTNLGFRGYVTDPIDKYTKNPIKYLEIENYLTDLREVKKIFRDKNINIFPENDARFYIEKESGVFSEKHKALEFHTYSCMAISCIKTQFRNSVWNPLSGRRDIILYLGEQYETGNNMELVHITPEEATFVSMIELCSSNLNVINLKYSLTWQNIDYYPDLHHLILSTNVYARDGIVKIDPTLLCNLQNLLCEIRPLSFS